jgi:hypothetical protein
MSVLTVIIASKTSIRGSGAKVPYGSGFRGVVMRILQAWRWVPRSYCRGALLLTKA